MVVFNVVSHFFGAPYVGVCENGFCGVVFGRSGRV